MIEAIKNELDRGGQVFYVLPRIKGRNFSTLSLNMTTFALGCNLETSRIINFLTMEYIFLTVSLYIFPLSTYHFILPYQD